LQAFAEQHDEDDDPSHMVTKMEMHVHVWKGLVAFSGIYLFFNAEKVLGVMMLNKNKKENNVSD